MNNTNSVSVLTDQFVLIHVDFDIWGGDAKLEKGDFSLGLNGALPPEAITSLGRKSLVDHTSLTPFSTRQRKTRVFLASIGIPFLNAFAIPRKRLREAEDHLLEVEKEWPLLVDHFINTLDDSVGAIKQKYPQFASSIDAGLPDITEIRERFGFDWTPYSIGFASDDDRSSANKGLNKAFSGLRDNLIKKIINQSSVIIKTMTGEGRGGSKGVEKQRCRTLVADSIANLRDYVVGVAAVDSRMDSVVILLDSVVKAIHANAQGRGYIEQPALGNAIRAMAVLTSEVSIDAYVSGTTSHDQLFNGWCNPPLLAMSAGRAAIDISPNLPPMKTQPVVSTAVKIGLKQEMELFFKSAAVQTGQTDESPSLRTLLNQHFGKSNTANTDSAAA